MKMDKRKIGNVKLCKYYWETIIKENVKQIDGMLSFYSKEDDDPEIIDDLSQLSELGHKILESNYFEKSDFIDKKCWDILNDFSNHKIDSIDDAIKIDKKWLRQYKKDYKSFNDDIRKFFKLIGDYIGEWL